jgi:hypothetical protein
VNIKGALSSLKALISFIIEVVFGVFESIQRLEIVGDVVFQAVVHDTKVDATKSTLILLVVHLGRTRASAWRWWAPVDLAARAPSTCHRPMIAAAKNPPPVLADDLRAITLSPA